MEDLSSYLGLHGIEAEVKTFSSKKKVGTELLRVSADLGAYSESHERETVFGGNTQTIVDTAKMAVLLNH